jgi:hypothetical protein
MKTTVLKLSALLGATVVDEGGTTLGRVHDVRVRRAAPAGPAAPPAYEVEGLIVGRRGRLARLGALAARRDEQAQPADVLPWSRVVEVTPGRVRVRS